LDGPRNHVLDKGAYGRYLANTVEQSKMAVMQAVTIITISTCEMMFVVCIILTVTDSVACGAEQLQSQHVKTD